MGKIGVHKDIVNLPIHFKNEILLNCFVSIMKKFNENDKMNVLKVSFQELWEMAGYKNRMRFKELDELTTMLTDSTCYKVKEDYEFKGTVIKGSIFTILQKNAEETLTIHVNEPFGEYIFNRQDIKILGKNKKKEKLTVEELDYWDTVLKDKKKELVLLEEAEVLGLKGKYAKRLYMILKQYAGTSGKLYMAVEQFKDVMEVPETYSYAELNRTIINRAKAELEKKGIFKFQDEPKGKGRRKIEKIELTFTTEMLYEAIKAKKEKSVPEAYKDGLQKNIYEEIEDRTEAMKETNLKGIKSIREMLKKC